MTVFVIVQLQLIKPLETRAGVAGSDDRDAIPFANSMDPKDLVRMGRCVAQPARPRPAFSAPFAARSGPSASRDGPDLERACMTLRQIRASSRPR